MKNNIFYFKKQKGVSIFFALIILSVLLTISVGLAIIVLNQIKILNEISDSVVAFYAADTGIEMAFDNGICSFNSSLTMLSNGASYDVSATLNCPSGINCCIVSQGQYHNISRNIRVEY